MRPNTIPLARAQHLHQSLHDQSIDAYIVDDAGTYPTVQPIDRAGDLDERATLALMSVLAFEQDAALECTVV